MIVEVLREGNSIIGLKYYSSNPIQNPETNKTGIGLAIEKFSDVGGTMLRQFTYYARLNEGAINLPSLTPTAITQTLPEQIKPLQTGKKGK